MSKSTHDPKRKKSFCTQISLIKSSTVFVRFQHVLSPSMSFRLFDSLSVCFWFQQFVFWKLLVEAKCRGLSDFSITNQLLVNLKITAYAWGGDEKLQIK